MFAMNVYNNTMSEERIRWLSHVMGDESLTNATRLIAVAYAIAPKSEKASQLTAKQIMALSGIRAAMTVSKSRRKLIARGWLTLEKRRGWGKAASYTLTIPAGRKPATTNIDTTTEDTDEE